jgi:hypothetical protein
MSLSDDKKNIFTTIGSYTSVIQATNIPDTTNLFPSVNNKNDIVPFMLDILKVVAGTDALQSLTGELFTKFIDKIEPEMKGALKNQVIQYNAGDNLPSYFASGGAGIRVKVKDIDVSGKFKTNPTSQTGQLIYDNSKPNFDSSVYDAIKNGNSIFGGLHMQYHATTDEMQFNMQGSSPSIGKWSDDYIDSLTIIDKKEFVSKVMNKIYGTITKNQGKTINEAHDELVVNALIAQMINGNDSFEISPEDNAALLLRAEEIINGIVNYDLGCGVMAASLPLSGLTKLVQTISGTTGKATDPNYVGKQINDTIAQSVTDQDVANTNKETIKDGFFQKLIKLITQALAEALTTNPQIRVILAIVSAFQNQGNVKIGQPKDDLKNFKTFLKCSANTAMKLINEFIFNLIKKFLVALLKPLLLKIIKEKINQFTDIIKSLIPTKT